MISFCGETLEVLGGFAESDEETIAGVFAAFIHIFVIFIVRNDNILHCDFGLVGQEFRKVGLQLLNLGDLLQNLCVGFGLGENDFLLLGFAGQDELIENLEDALIRDTLHPGLTDERTHMGDVVMVDIEQHGGLVEVVPMSCARLENGGELVDGQEVDVQFIAHVGDNLLILILAEVGEDLDGERVELLLAFIAISTC